jgi:pSer/pThr/pTyr-binding forkhead associated (FHA) protein
MPLNRKYELILSFQTGAYKGKHARIPSDRVVLGRSPICDIQLDEEGVSRQHALITYQHQKYILEDLSTENGVFVNSKRISKPQALYHKDKVKLGKAQFRILIPGTLRPKAVKYDADKLTLDSDLGAAGTDSPKKGLFKNKRLMIFGGTGLGIVVLLAVLLGGEDPLPVAEGETDEAVVAEEGKGDAGKKSAKNDLQKEIEDRQKSLAELLLKEADIEREKIEGQVLASKDENTAEDTKTQLAKTHFQSGLKELMAHSYVHAEKNFTMSLALNSKDLLVSEYLMRTRRKRRSVAEENYQLGKNYFASLQYERAISHFRHVINLLEIESQNLDHESKGYIATLENAKSYEDRATKAMADFKK